MKHETLMNAIAMVRYTQVVEDPFPIWSNIQRNYLQDRFNAFFKSLVKIPIPDISIHEAYVMGYNKAYQEIKRDIAKHLELEV